MAETDDCINVVSMTLTAQEVKKKTPAFLKNLLHNVIVKNGMRRSLATFGCFC